MKQFTVLSILLPLLLLSLLLTGCHVAPDNSDPMGTTPDPTAAPTNAPTQPTNAPTEPTAAPTEPTSPSTGLPEEFPADLNTDPAALAQFETLFSVPAPSDGYITGIPFMFRQALTHSYDSVQALQLWQFFYNGIVGENSTDVPDEVYDLFGFEKDWDCHGITATQVNTALQAVFGVTTEDLPESAFDRFGNYYEKTDSYYIGDNDANCPADLHIFGIRETENGCTEVYYGFGYGTKRTHDVYGCVTLTPAEDSWHVAANKFLWSAYPDIYPVGA